MNAKEARELAENRANRENKKIIDDVRVTIYSAAEKGKFTTTYYSSIPTHIKAIFEGEGYTITLHDSYRGEYYYTIKW